MITSPYGGESKLLERLHVSELARRYKNKCGADISFAFGEIQFAELHQCMKTGYKFWWPNELAGKEEFYRVLSSAWPNYYRTERWEYTYSRNLVDQNDACLEVGCGRGYFLKSIESICSSSVGLEFNTEAITRKVCDSEIYKEDISEYSLRNRAESGYDKVYAFQVLEHIPKPLEFLQACLAILKPGGLLVISVPNDEWIVHKNMQDPFNLPPHHIGGYDDEVFKKISVLLGMELVDIKFQPAAFPAVDVAERTKRKVLWRVFMRIFIGVGQRLLQRLHEPGHTMLVVLRKL
jgi:SAM-dependent methyltransferase